MSPLGRNCAAMLESTWEVWLQVAPPSEDVAANTSVLHGEHSRLPLLSEANDPLRKSLQNTASLPLRSSTPTEGKSLIAYPFVGRHARNCGQSFVITPESVCTGWVAMSSPTLTGSLHVAPPSRDRTNSCWQA